MTYTVTNEASNGLTLEHLLFAHYVEVSKHLLDTIMEQLKLCSHAVLLAVILGGIRREGRQCSYKLHTGLIKASRASRVRQPDVEEV